MSLTMKYFVLKPRGCDNHAAASRAAMRAYAEALLGADPKLSRELREWADRESVRIDESSGPYDADAESLKRVRAYEQRHIKGRPK